MGIMEACWSKLNGGVDSYKLMWDDAGARSSGLRGSSESFNAYKMIRYLGT